MSEQLANIKFVEEVEKYPCLYDYRLKDYLRKDLTKQAWKDVGKVNHLTGPQSKEKWKNLRTVFGRHLKLGGCASKKGKPYYLADAMKFAIPFIKTHTSTNSEEENPEDAEGTQQETILGEDFESCTVSSLSSPLASETISIPLSSSQTCILPPSNQSSSIHFPKTSNPRHSKRHRTTGDFCDITEFLENIKRKKINQNNFNPNFIEISRKRFLLSLVPDINSFTDAQMKTFRIKVLTLIDDIYSSDV